SLSSIREGIAPTSPLGTTKATTIFILLLLLFGTAVADSAGVGNGSESGAQRQRRTPQEFMVVTPEKMNAVAGNTILLPCSYTCTISGVTQTLVEWFRRDGREEERIYLFPNGNSNRGPLKASWMGDLSKCDASITVSDIQTHDSGRYRCEVTVYPQNMQDIGYLQLNVKSPSELVVVTPDKMDAVAGTTFLLPCAYTCTISGVTHTLVEWFRIIDGREERIYKYTSMGDVSKCDASITVSDIQTHVSGRYHCEVTVFPQNIQDIGYLQLTVHPRTDLAVVIPDAKDATVGSTALLPCSYTCTITGIRHTLVEWFRTIDGHDEKVYKIIYRKRSLRPMQVTWVGDESTCNVSITISDIQTHDAGQYRCEVTIDRYDKPSMKDIGYLQLNVHNEPGLKKGSQCTQLDKMQEQDQPTQDSKGGDSARRRSRGSGRELLGTRTDKPGFIPRAHRRDPRQLLAPCGHLPPPKRRCRPSAAAADHPPGIGVWISCWRQWLQESMYRAVHLKGIGHTNAHALSRLPAPIKCTCSDGSARCRPPAAAQHEIVVPVSAGDTDRAGPLVSLDSDLGLTLRERQQADAALAPLCRLAEATRADDLPTSGKFSLTLEGLLMRW
ncbi:unnamed protein product, partial [Lampetra fluviatilis]